MVTQECTNNGDGTYIHVLIDANWECTNNGDGTCIYSCTNWC